MTAPDENPIPPEAQQYLEKLMVDLGQPLVQVIHSITGGAVQGMRVMLNAAYLRGRTDQMAVDDARLNELAEEERRRYPQVQMAVPPPLVVPQ